MIISKHKHIGFCVGKGLAISNSTEEQTPKKHSIDYGGNRKPIAYYNKNIS